ncbi:MAG: UDP-N-acetylglucosamine 1-carboxyvinyltransferase [Firmicutes bacterium]|jgi:UDP-N-acetylglucosamine 1-carboxyvinyltransferase|nr:UDP-N-acetylglucosamine 1-carboxyvinyltransferase [Bacillota bacterium]HOB21911.1 UDP-N-acetylglucosamine 1-carboxyvinyltransferase [Bacillota bacterium]HQD39752.1 UDP-N-acetylglucosamine 1-carboxyvinyltransferase [Bacillota bacterium]
MGKLQIEGGRRLEGVIPISGAKNSALAIIMAAALAKGESILENVPHDTDVAVACQILEELGVKTFWDHEGKLHIQADNLRAYQAPHELVRKMRASFYVAGVLLARLGKAEVPLPGGCSLGSRPVDFHLKGFSSMGAEISIEYGCMKAEAKKLSGCKYYINRASVGTTVNLMLAASLAEGTTLLENAAKEPEIVDLAIYLNSMGAKIRGAGTEVIRIDGVKELVGVEYDVIPDRIEAGTYLLAAAITGGDITVTDVVPEHLRAFLLKLRETGVQVEEGESTIRAICRERPKAVDIETAPYPGFPTDLQQPFLALMTIADGTSVIRETIFDRFRFVDELRLMGADVKTERDTAIVRGVDKLLAAPIEATDLRAGAALVLAALAAEGVTTITGVEYLDRGYEFLEDKLASVGAKVKRLKE